MQKQAILIGLFVTAFALGQKPIFTTAKIKAATVYANAAELTQNTLVALPAGNSEIVINNIANYLNENTVQIGAPSTVTILSVQFTTNYISEFETDQSSPAIKKVKDSITLVQRELKRIQILSNSNTQTIALLDANKTISAANTSWNVMELTKLVAYYSTKRSELENTIVDLAEKQTLWNKKLSALNNKLQFHTKDPEKYASGKLILQVRNETAGNIPLAISYITNTASWNPFYDLRTENIQTPINMMYKAAVMQNSGIDWKNIQLTLSSGNPNQNNQAPDLQPWFLHFQNTYAATKTPPRSYAAMESLDNRLQEDGIMANGLKKEKKALAYSVQSLHATDVQNQLNVSFDIAIPYTILSNGKIHSVALKEIKLPATYTYFAAPKADKEAFLLAEISDYSKYNLLPGEANIIFEGMHVGKTQINPSQTADTLKLSMGRDKKITLNREKIADKSGTKFLSSYKEQLFTYDITVRNNKKEAVVLELKDQYPLPTDKEISVVLVETSKANVNQETGLLTWHLKLDSNTTQKIRISYKVRYPKDTIITNL
ncbi:DUF4139 domain-containing protein [Flavobacterium crassostreae]|uniref:DUF4139 domain-containing protein n=1 Tax=Flavobacterium crassostreae TaxID=1763534 RepID=A0A1B9E9M2_9FLAO|nr:DUF4139 domain-containing protein [Flavobacterium crassostreae]OCB78657.1 hypothetical protein LPBF_01295 [Flavobacterium crassostreae]